MTEDPDTLMRQGILLKDLRYRFGACAIRITPLRERRVEIPLLAQHALARCPEATKVEGPTRLSEAALQILLDAEYEGDAREPRRVVEYAYLVARADGVHEIGPEHVPETLHPQLWYRRHGDRAANRVAVERALSVTSGNVKAAAKMLGITRNALRNARGAVRSVL